MAESVFPTYVRILAELATDINENVASMFRVARRRISTGKRAARSIRGRSVRAGVAERSRELPGDELIAGAIGSVTHAITIDRPRRDVWRWLIQMGAGRAGWYSYDSIDNGGRSSSPGSVPGFQNVSIGSLFPAVPGATDGFFVLQLGPERFLVLGWAPRRDSPPAVTWTFVMEDIEPDRTRLIVRARAGPGYRFHGLPPWLVRRIVPFGHFVMQRKQLLGIARRAEEEGFAPGSAGQPQAEEGCRSGGGGDGVSHRQRPQPGRAAS
jgi:hypothetical protein